MPNLYSLSDVQKSGTWEDVDPFIVRDVPLPDAGDRTRWQGIKHSDLLDALLKAFDYAGLKQTDEVWTLSGGGDRLFGYVSLSLDENNFDETKETLGLPDTIEYSNFAFEHVTLRLGVRHSNDSSTALYFMVAPRVKIHDAGITVKGGDISLHRRHTRGTAKDGKTLQEAVNEGVKTFLIKGAQIEQEIKLLKNIPLTRASAHHIMVVAATKKILPWAMIKKVNEFFGKGDSAWDLYIAFSRASSKYIVPREMGIITQTRELIFTLCNMEADAILAESAKESGVQKGEEQAEDDHGAECRCEPEVDETCPTVKNSKRASADIF